MWVCSCFCCWNYGLCDAKTKLVAYDLVLSSRNFVSYDWSFILIREMYVCDQLCFYSLITFALKVCQCFIYLLIWRCLFGWVALMCNICSYFKIAWKNLIMAAFADHLTSIFYSSFMAVDLSYHGGVQLLNGLWFRPTKTYCLLIKWYMSSLCWEYSMYSVFLSLIFLDS